jgi:hypothetical protein
MVRGENGKSKMDIPAPLAPDAEPRMAQDGTRLWNPDWLSAPTIGVNSQYIEMIVQLVFQREQVNL